MHVVIAALHRPIKPTGVCRHAVNLANCIAEKIEVTEISLIIGVWQQEYFDNTFNFSLEKINLVHVDIKNTSLSRNKWFIWGLPQLANNLNADIVHLAFPLPFFRAKFNSPVVTTIHDLYPYECPQNFGFPQVLFNRLFLRQCIQNSDGLTCVSQVTLKMLKLYFTHLRSRQIIEVVYNYVDLDRNTISTQPPQRISDTNYFLLSVAQHRKNKNLDSFIKAYSNLMKSQQIDRNCQLIIVGSSAPETENLKNLIQELDLVDRVLLLSAISDRELCWLYQNCQVFVIPSSTEGFCLPLAEALHFSDRVVCSDIPIFREIATDDCTFFSLKNDAVANLAGAIIKSLNQPSIIDRNYTKRFKKSNIAQQYLQLYLQLIKA